MKGTIKSKPEGKQFLFISCEGQAKDIFAHASETNGQFDQLKEGDTVTFEIKETERGSAATNVARA